MGPVATASKVALEGVGMTDGVPLATEGAPTKGAEESVSKSLGKVSPAVGENEPVGVNGHDEANADCVCAVRMRVLVLLKLTPPDTSFEGKKVFAEADEGAKSSIRPASGEKTGA